MNRPEVNDRSDVGDRHEAVRVGIDTGAREKRASRNVRRQVPVAIVELQYRCADIGIGGCTIAVGVANHRGNARSVGDQRQNYDRYQDNYSKPAHLLPRKQLRVGWEEGRTKVAQKSSWMCIAVSS